MARGDPARQGADVVEHDHIVDHILEMADILPDGVIQQFPKRFAK